MSAAVYGMRDRAMAYGMRDAGLIKGVCARIAERAGVPVWMPRVAFLIFGVLHWLLALIVYFVLSKIMCARRGVSTGFDVGPVAPPPNAVRDRFGALDARLADLEAATVQQESSLRRAFRDLERS